MTELSRLTRRLKGALASVLVLLLLMTGWLGASHLHESGGGRSCAVCAASLTAATVTDPVIHVGAPATTITRILDRVGLSEPGHRLGLAPSRAPPSA